MSDAIPRVRVDRSRDPRVARVILDRPEVRNAFDDLLVKQLAKHFRALQADAGVRVIEISGAGKVFCAGADLNWMKKTASYTMEENRRDSAELFALFKTIDECEKPVVGRVHGSALGGGTGLVSVCDVVIAAEGTMFGTTEVRLGIIPAVISSFVVRKIGESQARAWFVTGERHDADEARRVGLVHSVVPEDRLEESAQDVIESILLGAPQALAEAKKLARTVGLMGAREVQLLTTQRIAERRASAEGQEGMKAFLEKRPAKWTERPEPTEPG